MAADITRDTFDTTKHYDKLVLQQGVPLVDADFNESQDILRNRLNTIIEKAIGDAFVGDGFKIVGTGAANDFTIKAGNGFVFGKVAVKETDESYKTQADFVVYDALTPPGADTRTDTIYLDVYEAPIDGTDDPNIIDPTYGAEVCQRIKLMYVVRVAVGGACPANAGGHVYTTLATMLRTAGQSTIEVGDVTDARADLSVTLASLDEISKEVVTARGSKAALDTRLSIALNADGTLKAHAISHADLSDMPDNTTGLVADHDSRYSIGADGGIGATHNKALLASQADNAKGAGLVGNFSVDDTVDQTTAAGAATTVYARLCQFAAAINDIVGAANWYDAIPASLTAMWAKFHAATGHAHTGAADDAPQILASGIADDAVTTVKILDQNVTGAKVADATLAPSKFTAAVYLVPTGAISMFGGLVAPSGYLLCAGQAVDRATYNDLFTIISTTYGVGDGSTTFNVPNLKGRVALGYGDASAETPALTDRNLNDKGGEETHQLTADESALPAHTHTGYGILATGADWGNAGVKAPTPTNTGSTTQALAVSAHENMPPYTVVNFIIKT